MSRISFLFLPVLGLAMASCRTTTPTFPQLPKKLPDIQVNSPSSTPPTSMSRTQYPFDSSGRYIEEWAAAGSGVRVAASDDSPRSSSTGSSSSSSPTRSTTSPTRSTTSSKKPSSTYHTVRQGDTLYAIARKYGSSVGSIQSANGLSGSNIRIGQKLKIPR